MGDERGRTNKHVNCWILPGYCYGAFSTRASLWSNDYGEE